MPIQVEPNNKVCLLYLNVGDGYFVGMKMNKKRNEK